MNKLLTEFELIDKFFSTPSAKRNDVILGVGDDCALLKIPEGQILAVSSDTSVAGVHFFEKADPLAIGYKTLAVSLSDLAAMGATPAWVMLALTLPQVEETWLKKFCEGFFSLIKQYSLQLVGGDTTQGPLSITTQVFGFLPIGKALRRDKAKVGDLIYVTGHLGDAGLALLAATKQLTLSDEHLLEAKQRLDFPQPRLEVGVRLLDFANAAIDISDGLAADLSHILKCSKVGATIELTQLPLSPVLKQLPCETAYQLALTAGDDYELCFTAPPSAQKDLEILSSSINIPFTAIGIIEAEPGLRVKTADGGNAIQIQADGYQHFLR